MSGESRGNTNAGLLQALFDGPLDIVGDVHGEIDALRSLLSHLGYVDRPSAPFGRGKAGTFDGVHPQRRRLVFVGDLCDRGPDSVAVVELVQGLVERGLAQCILGNHELNVLRGDHKQGNRWIQDPAHHENTDLPSRIATPDQREAIVAFFHTLPLALERPDLRVVHATWNDDAVATLRDTTTTESPAPTLGALETFLRHEDAMKRALREEGLLEAGKAELEPHKHALHDEAYPMPLLSRVGLSEEKRQMLNPVRILTSGPERATKRQFFATGKWRFCDRVTWWDEYTADTPVVCGHYWRGNQVALFGEATDADWLGPKRNVYCVDFSVGLRFRERKQHPQRGVSEPFANKLAALRWPERDVVFDDGRTLQSRA